MKQRSLFQPLSLVLVVLVMAGCTLSPPNWSPPEYATLRGTVVDEHGEPIAHPVTVTLGRTMVQSVVGEYQLDWISPGKHVLSASSPGYRAHSQIVTISPGETHELDIVLVQERESRRDGSAPVPSASPWVLQGRTIVVDPGHGGSNPNLGDYGAVGTHAKEKTNVLAVGLYLKELLEAAGAHVVMTRETDVNPSIGTLFEDHPHGQLYARVDLAERAGADVYVSLHNDWHANTSARGVKTFYYSEAGRRLAEAIQPEVAKHLGAIDRGIEWASFHVIRRTSMPAILIELGFLSNPEEDYLLSTDPYRRKAAQGLYAGLVRYFNSV